MKTRSLGIAFAALLALAPVRGNAEEAATPSSPANAAKPANGTNSRLAGIQGPSIPPRAGEAMPSRSDETLSRKPRRAAKKQSRRYAYWEPFPLYWPSYQRQHLSWRRIAWFGWF
jgi:hypothetical protein